MIKLKIGHIIGECEIINIFYGINASGNVDKMVAYYLSKEDKELHPNMPLFCSMKVFKQARIYGSHLIYPHRTKRTKHFKINTENNNQFPFIKETLENLNNLTI